MLEQKIDQDLKAAMLAGDTRAVSVLRGIKSAALYAKVASGTRDQQMTDEALRAVLQKEAKKRQESADLYYRGSAPDKAEAELAEKAIVERYLPAQLDETALRGIVDRVIAGLGGQAQTTMGAVIGRVKQQTAGSADGAMIAHIVKERLTQ